MKLKEAISKADELRLNTLSDEQKVDFLRRLDGELLEMFAADEKPLPVEEPAEDEEPTPQWPVDNVWPEEDPELLMPFPHDDIYPLYLCAQIDFYNMEEDRYQNDMAIFNTAMADARAWWRRNHRPWRRRNWRVM